MDVDAILASLRDHPQDWRCNEFELVHEPSRIRLWVANGWRRIRVEDRPRVIGLVARACIWMAFRRWLAWETARRLGASKKLVTEEWGAWS